MKILMKPVEMICLFSEVGSIKPIKFRLEGEVVKVDQVTSQSEEKLAGNRMIIFRCQSVVNEVLRQFELKYEITTCKWYLFKM